MDIIYIILDEIISDRDIELVFIETYKEMMPDVYDKAKEAIRIAERGEVFLPVLKESTSKNERQWFYRYLLYELRAFDLIDSDVALMWVMRDANDYYNQYVLSETELLIRNQNNTSWDDEEESVFDSAYFERIINKRRIALSEELGVPETELSNFIHTQMQVRADYGTLETMEDIHDKQYAQMNISKGYPGILNNITMSFIANHGGGNDWLTFMTNDVNNVYAQKKYRPDVDNIIKAYYKQVVLNLKEEFESDEVLFTKINVSRAIKGRNIKEDIVGIYASYEIDILSKMMMYILEDYYRNFSWERITENSVADRYNVIINQLKGIIEQKDKHISSLNETNSVLQMQMRNDANNALVQITKRNDELLKKIEEKDQEIHRLKETIASYESFINDIENVEETEATEVDIKVLQGKRYLFVGYTESDFDDLKKLFPSSIFMTNNTMSLNGISVDAIVMIIKRMSHSMYYKIKSSSLYQETLCIRSNAIKSEGVINDMWSNISK